MYLVAKIGCDTAENEPLKVWGGFNYSSFRSLGTSFDDVLLSTQEHLAKREEAMKAGARDF